MAKKRRGPYVKFHFIFHLRGEAEKEVKRK